MCKCFEDTLNRVKEHLKDQIPDDAVDVEIDWKESSFIIAKGQYAPTNPKVGYSYTPIKKDGSKAKSKKKSDIAILASHCCFCGEKYERPGEQDDE